MGGLAFSSGPDALYTPRMPKTVYIEVKQRCFGILKGLFEIVDSPIDGPGKTDFGDIDILLFGPKSPIAGKTEMADTLKSALGATRMIIGRTPETAVQLAIPWPKTSNVSATAVFSCPNGHGDGAPSQDPADDTHQAPQDKHIQVDVRVCNDMHSLRWTLFKHAHGDIWNMIGSTIRPYGLTVDEEALWLRIPEVEKINKKRAKIMLSRNPDQILRFVDIDPDGYWKGPFDDVHTMAEFVAQCRMFWVPPAETPQDEEEGGVPGSLEPGSRYSEDRKKLKSNDRRRMNQRPGFRRWIDEFYPECRRRGRFLEKKTTREKVTQEAFEWFGVREEFEQRRREFLLEQQRDYIWKNVIKETIPQPEDNSNVPALQYRGTMVKAFKRIILDDDDRYGIVRPSDLKGEDGFFIPENIVDFIVRNEEAVAKVALEQQNFAMLEKKARKERESEAESGNSSTQTREGDAV